MSVASIRTFVTDRIQVMAVLIVACFVAVLTLRSQSAASYPTYFLALLMLATFPAWRDVLRITLVRLVLALLVWLSLSTLWSEPFVMREAVSVWTRALLVFAFVVAVAECQLRGQMQRWVSIAMTVVGAVAAIAAVVNFLLMQPDDGRLNGLGQLDTHVVAALVYGVVLVFLLHSAHESKSELWRTFAAFAGAACVFAVYLSDSRNAWVSVTLGVAAYFLCRWCRDPKQFLSTIVACGLLLGILIGVVILSDDLREVLLPRGDSFRPYIWGDILGRLEAASWLVGAGIISPDDIVQGDIVFPHPHSMYLAVLFQGGMIALACYLVILFLTVRTLLRNFDHTDTPLAMGILMIALLSHLLDGHELIDKVGDTWFLIWLPVGLSIGMMWRPGLRR